MPQPSRYTAIRRRTCEILEQARSDDRVSRIADVILMMLILFSVVVTTLESMEPLRLRYAQFFDLTEVVVVILFSAEYLLRFWSVVDSKRRRRGDRFGARLGYVLSPMALIDLIAVAPFYLVHLGLFATTSNSLVLRSVRLLRILKLTRYSSSFAVLTSVVRENMRGLGAAVFLLMVVMMIAASGIYVFEREAQPQAFGSIPAAMWWAFATLTTVGYGDVTPITALGKMFGASITVVGVGMVALPTAILASAFSAQLRERARRFSQRVDEAIEDGVVTTEERVALERLRRELGIGSELAKQIMATERAQLVAQNTPAAGVCPHCRRTLATPAEPADSESILRDAAGAK